MTDTIGALQDDNLDAVQPEGDTPDTGGALSAAPDTSGSGVLSMLDKTSPLKEDPEITRKRALIQSALDRLVEVNQRPTLPAGYDLPRMMQGIAESKPAGPGVTTPDQWMANGNEGYLKGLVKQHELQQQDASSGLQAAQQGLGSSLLNKPVNSLTRDDLANTMMSGIGSQTPAAQASSLTGLLGPKSAPPTIKDAMGNPLVWNQAKGTFEPIKGASMFGTAGSIAGGEGQAGVAGASGDDFLKTLPPQIGLQVKGLAEGKIPFPSSFALKSPYWQAMLGAVSQYDPSFDAVNYGKRFATAKDFGSGKAAQNVTAMNTALGHIDSLMDSAEALKNTDYPAVNTVTNWAANQTGDPRIKAFNTNRDAAVGELTRVFRGTGGSAEDIKSWKTELDAANSPAQFQSVMGKMADLLNSRLDSMKEQYNRGMGTTKEGYELLTPKAQKAYLRLTGAEPDDATATDKTQEAAAKRPNPDAEPPVINSKEEYDQLPSGALYKKADGHIRKKQ